MAQVRLASGSVLPDIAMSQSAILVGALIGGFVLWLALNNKLGVYWSLLLGGGSSPSAASGASSTPPSAPTSSTATPSPSTSSNGTIPATQGAALGLGGTTATGGSGTVGYNALFGAGSGLTAGSASLWGGA